MSDRPVHYVTIEGVIGVGKTSLTKALSQFWGGQQIKEEVEENPFLSDFYKDPRRYAFQTQLFFLLSRYRQLKGFVQRDIFQPLIVCDYLFQKDKIFASINLDDHEMALYDQVLPLLEREIPQPDRVVYLQASLPSLLQRIEKRGRPFEKDISPEYLETLMEAYNHFFIHYTDAPLLIVNTDHVDFTQSSESVEELAGRILEQKAGTSYYAPVEDDEIMGRKISRKSDRK
ncbi:MAG: deoxynucleoside kinase [Candidatus Eisenbacteria bacterium]|uniref:Deoxynucleoside kinase n=1 Tax=Eiseniibacteriota bacterium TaxID=2212470 RepID=A0A948RU60_UNCEI|nr:deoxynucleoside kinase [Candidatus Eisenbacteria bacterium]MBU1951277.1 deoxynucleoside kinase [Candidatus Eisenbacteria bacterium]MBU2689623.1 deoxynucleoside kinase [Candidatus Eisenbacteria bacterium]